MTSRTLITGASAGLGVEVTKHAAKDGRKVPVPGLMNKVFAVLPCLSPHAMVVWFANILLSKKKFGAGKGFPERIRCVIVLSRPARGDLRQTR